MCGLVMWMVGMCSMVMCLGFGLDLWVWCGCVGLVLVLGLDVLMQPLLGELCGMGGR